ncbi:hypothetical protein GW17_00020210 [Ensete ventricosum]|nr:hypothetical protein GW17_00020210 [Ensete ventricosum]
MSAWGFFISTRGMCKLLGISVGRSGTWAASGRSEDDAVGNLPRVRRELTEGIGSLLGWRKGVHRKKAETY